MKRILTTAAAIAALAMTLTACGSSNGAADDAGASSRASAPASKPTEASVRAFYADVIQMVKDGDIAGLCQVSSPALLAQMKSYGLGTCTESWTLISKHTSQADLDDPVNNILIADGKATLKSGTDPWSMHWENNGWVIDSMD